MGFPSGLGQTQGLILVLVLIIGPVQALVLGLEQGPVNGPLLVLESSQACSKFINIPTQISFSHL